MKIINQIITLLLVATNSINIFAQNKACIAIGSSATEVRNVQGTPSKISNYTTEDVWYYSKSSISFQNGKVSEYDNAGTNLKICKEVFKGRTAKDIGEERGVLYPERSKSTASKKETQEWILKKLNEHTPDEITESGRDIFGDTYYYYINNTKFSTEDSYLVVNLTEVRNSQTCEETYKIPIYDLRQLSNSKGKLGLSTDANTIIYLRDGKEMDKRMFFSVEYNFHDEEDLQKRLQSALAHLMKFYSKPVSKEPF